MKKKTLTMILMAGICAGMLAGCQETPKESIVKKKVQQISKNMRAQNKQVALFKKCWVLQNIIPTRERMRMGLW